MSLPMYCRWRASPPRLVMRLREQDGVEQGFGQVERRQLGFLERDQPGAQILGGRGLALAHALAGRPEFLRFLVLLCIVQFCHASP